MAAWLLVSVAFGAYWIGRAELDDEGLDQVTPGLGGEDRGGDSWGSIQGF